MLVGLARGSRHELGVMGFAMVLRSRGVQVTYLGADLPVEAWVETVRELGPDAVVLAVPTVDGRTEAADGTWPFLGYTMTGFTDAEEALGGLAPKAKWLVQARLTELGAASYTMKTAVIGAAGFSWLNFARRFGSTRAMSRAPAPSLVRLSDEP